MNEDELMNEKTNWYEWGYQLSGGEQVWQIDYGTDGSWTPAMLDLNMSHVDIYAGREYVDIRSELDRAGLFGAAVIRRKVIKTLGGKEVVSG